MFALIAAVLLVGQSEGVVRPPLPGFVIGSQQSTRGASILEEVPKGETVEKWTRMVTTQRFEGFAEQVDVARFLNVLVRSTERACAGANASQVRHLGASAEVRIDCPLNPKTGLPETFIARAIADGRNMHVFQVAWRRVPSAADIAWGEHYLQGVFVRP